MANISVNFSLLAPSLIGPPVAASSHVRVEDLFVMLYAPMKGSNLSETHTTWTPLMLYHFSPALAALGQG